MCDQETHFTKRHWGKAARVTAIPVDVFGSTTRTLPGLLFTLSYIIVVMRAPRLFGIVFGNSYGFVMVKIRLTFTQGYVTICAWCAC